MLNDAIEARFGGSSDIASIASILNCEAWDFSSSGNEYMDEVILLNVCPFQEPLIQQGLQVSQLEVVDEWHDMLDYTVQCLSPSRHYRATWYKLFHPSIALQYWSGIGQKGDGQTKSQGKCTSQDQQNVKLYRMILLMNSVQWKRLGKVTLGVKRNYKNSLCEM